MWKCTNCHHVELSTDKPQRCPVCGAEAEKFVPHEVSGIKGTKTLKNLKAGFVAESQAHLRNLAFAMKAEQEGYAQVARLFRAIAEAEAVHAFNHFRLLGAVSGTQDNLESAFERENLAASTYPQFIRVATEEGNTSVATVLGYSRDVEKGMPSSIRRRWRIRWLKKRPSTTSARSAAMSPTAFFLMCALFVVLPKRNSGR